MQKKWIFETELALKAASSSARIIEERGLTNLVFKTKETPRDIVTELDIFIEKHVRRILETTGYKIIGEETASSDVLYIDSDKPTWFIDPIDGTTNLVSGIPFYATSIGLFAKSTFVVGAVAVPALKEIFFTMGKQGAFKNTDALSVQPADLKNSLVAASFSGSYDDQKQRQQEYELFGKINDMGRGCLRLGSAAINICYVACGRLQATYGINNKIWDIAGALSIALQAGCHVYLDWDNRGFSVSYVIGVPDVAEEIAEFLKLKKSLHLATIPKI